MITCKVTEYFYRSDTVPFYKVHYKKWYHLFWEYHDVYESLSMAMTVVKYLKANKGKREKVVYLG